MELCGAWWSLVVLGGAWWILVVVDGAWWCLVLLGAAWRCLVLLGSAWWWFMVRGSRPNSVKIKSRYFAGCCGLKHVPCMSTLLGIFVLGHYGALYTQNDEK